MFNFFWFLQYFLRIGAKHLVKTALKWNVYLLCTQYTQFTLLYSSGRRGRGGSLWGWVFGFIIIAYLERFLRKNRSKIMYKNMSSVIMLRHISCFKKGFVIIFQSCLKPLNLSLQVTRGYSGPSHFFSFVLYNYKFLDAP